MGIACPNWAGMATDFTTEVPYGLVQQMSPLVRRVLARNPSPYTYTGTGTYIIGVGEVAVIDPGPDDPAHIAAIAAAIEGERLAHILITHTHMDHSPAARPLQALLGGAIAGCAPLALEDDGPRIDAAFDRDYHPARVLADGEAVAGPGWTLRAIATPGHTSNHLCYALEQERALFSGDHVMGWSTSVVSPPDGDMAAYMRSLALLLERDDLLYYPTHGPPVTEPQRLVRGMIAHRRQRERQVLNLLAEGAGHIDSMVKSMYAMVDQRLLPAAARSVLAHLIDLEARGVVRREGDIWMPV